MFIFNPPFEIVPIVNAI